MTMIAWLAAGLLLMSLFVGMAHAMRVERALRRQEHGLREEYEAYAQLNATLDGRCGGLEPARDLARAVCLCVAQHSAFAQAALLLRDAEQRLQVMGSAGVDDLMLRALDAWGERFAREQKQAGSTGPRRKSYIITVGPMEAFDPTRKSGRIGCRKAMVLPLWSDAGAMLGALVGCPGARDAGALHSGTAALESLAVKLARAVEHAALNEKLMRAEKMAGLGRLAKGVAHELNNPLTAVLGFAELIAETAAEDVVRADAGSIITQALRMKETVESLLQFWRPATMGDRVVDVAGLLREVAARCEPPLRGRGVTLLLQVEDGEQEATVRGNKERLTNVFERLLSNAEKAVAAREEERGASGSKVKAIRVTLAREEKTLQVVVSDTGIGFSEPAKVFDPFYTTRQPGGGQGMGLAVSYGVVREHGGEISAFNLQPHGAAVVVELPLARTVRESGTHAVVG